MTAAEPHPTDLETLEAMARQLEASGHYRLLRRFSGNTLHTDHDPDTLRQGVYLDVETTGKDPGRDEIIELAMVPFTYDAEGRLCGVGTPFVERREPSVPITEEITKITGITHAMVAGKSIDPDQVAAFIEPAVTVWTVAITRPALQRARRTDWRFKHVLRRCRAPTSGRGQRRWGPKRPLCRRGKAVRSTAIMGVDLGVAFAVAGSWRS